MSVTLPEAAPRDYARWLAVWREVEQRAVDRGWIPGDEVLERAPRAREAVADFLAREVAAEVARQAHAAERAGRGRVAPRVRGDGELLAEALGYLIRWTGWLREPGVPEALGLEPLDEEAARMWRGVLHAFRERVAREMHARARAARERQRSGRDQRLPVGAGRR